MRRAILAAALGVALSFAGGAGSASAPTLQLVPCPSSIETGGPIFPNLRVDCGTLAVPENRSNPNSRMIRFGVAIVHAPSGHPRSDPIVFMDGGPSIGAIQDFAWAYFYMDADGNFQPLPFVQDRDLIVIDSRGEGVATPYLSDPRLGCPEFAQADHDSFYAKPFIGSNDWPGYADAISSCRARLVGDGVDLTAYNSAEIAADLEALRKSLGVSKWNLWAISADGTAGLTYMRLYPNGIRSAVLDSPQNPAMNIGPDYYRGKAELLEMIMAKCAANAACNAAYPNLHQAFYAEIAKLESHPEQFRIQIPGPDITIQVLGRWLYNDAMQRFGFGFNVNHLLSQMWRASHGELGAVYQEWFDEDFPAEFGPPGFDDPYEARGRTWSLTCRDLINFVPQSAQEQVALDYPPLAPIMRDDHFDGPYGPAMCRIWNNGIADAAQHQPVASSIPTMITIAEFDTGVTPNISRRIGATLKNSFTFEFPDTGHLPLAFFNPVVDCARSIVVRFLDSPTRRPDASCIASLPQHDYTP